MTDYNVYCCSVCSTSTTLRLVSSFTGTGSIRCDRLQCLLLFCLQYFYNSQTSQFLYWDGEQQMYRPAPAGEGGANPPTDQQQQSEDTDSKKPHVDDKKDKDKKEKVKVAKRIAKVSEYFF